MVDENYKNTKREHKNGENALLTHNAVHKTVT
jgi:hypothetical protein